MATIQMTGGQTFDVSQTYEELQSVVSQGWTGTIVVNDRSTNVSFTIKVPSIVAVQP